MPCFEGIQSAKGKEPESVVVAKRTISLHEISQLHSLLKGSEFLQKQLLDSVAPTSTPTPASAIVTDAHVSDQPARAPSIDVMSNAIWREASLLI